MVVRSWLAGFRRHTGLLLDLHLRANCPRRRRDASRTGVEILEQRCLLTDINLGNLGTGGITIFGADGGDLSGYSVSTAGDVNGDGFDDLVIGADHGRGVNNLQFAAGECYLVFGGPALPATINLASLGSSGVTIIGKDATDFSGNSVSSAGDLNGDGFDDVIIGARGGDGADDTKSFAGEAYVIFGAATLPATIQLASLNSSGMTIFGIDGFDETGGSVSGAGDVNGDGFDDVIIGAFASAGAGNNAAYAGESYVIFGGESLPATIDLGSLNSSGITIFGAEAGDNSGVSVSNAGDVNGDGFDDVIIGAQSADGLNNLKLSAGESYLIFGGDSLPATIDLANLGAAGMIIFGADATDFSGHAVSNAGDVNGDGFDDLLIGAFGADGVSNASGSAGETYLIFGAETLPATIDLANLGAAGITIFGIDPLDYSGHAVSSAGDVNGDGFADLLIGALLAAGPGNTAPNAGEAYLVFGAATLPATIDLSDLGDAGNTFLAIDGTDNVGQSVSTAGDINGDGLDDIIIGARFADGAGNSKMDSGESYVIFGGTIRVGGPAVTWIKKDPPVVVLPQLVVDAAADPAGGTLTLSATAIGTPKKLLDQFTTPATAGLGATTGPQFANGILTLQIQLNENVTSSSLQSFLRGITFATKGKGLKTATRTIDVTLAEAGGGSVSTIRQTINVLKKAESAPLPFATSSLPSKRVESKANTFPDVTGGWAVVTDPDGAAISGILELDQSGSGKKVTGTLTNPGQPPGSFKAKFVQSREEFTTLVGKLLNRVVGSKRLQFGCNLIGELLESRYQQFEGDIHTPEGDVPFTGTRLPG